MKWTESDILRWLRSPMNHYIPDRIYGPIENYFKTIGLGNHRIQEIKEFVEGFKSELSNQEINHGTKRL